MKKIKITCTGSRAVDINKLKNFQGNLKELKESELEKLKASITKYGFSFPVFVWKDNIVDGHQRVFATLELIKDGYQVDKIPVVDIEAKNKKEAGEKLLVLNSQYAKMTDEGLYEFLNDFDIDIKDIGSDLELPDINIDKFIEGYVDDLQINDINYDPPEETKSKMTITFFTDSKQDVIAELDLIQQKINGFIYYE